jgi:Vitamin B12 dependent methionine synthase, activation domain
VPPDDAWDRAPVALVLGVPFSPSEPAPPIARTVHALALAPHDGELRRRLGYPPSASARALPAAIEQALHQGREHLAPRGGYAVFPIDEQSPSGLGLGGSWVTGRVGEFLRGATRVAVFVVTAGEEISALAADEFARGDAVAAFALDALGSWAAEAAADALMLEVAAHLHAGEALSLRHSPGYCSMPLAEQQTLFGLVAAEDIGVALQPSLMMRPLKSVSGVVGLGPKACWSEQRSPCATCEDLGCPARR